MRHLMILLLLVSPLVGAAEIATRPLMPEFTNNTPAHWFNSKPLKRADLTGKVALIDVWTFGCWNCYRSFPWLKDLEQKFADQDFVVVGIHSPEFAHEKQPEKVAAKIKEFGLEHPVMMDNDFRYWRALNNRFWPAFYLADKSGRLRYLHVGETHAGDRRAKAIERQVQELLSEGSQQE
jgi:thiol-disulfide isomerase/thioredoxin